MADQNNALDRLANSLAPKTKQSASDAFLRADEIVMLLIDVSGSMAGQPAMRLQDVVSGIQAQGQVPMIAFGGDDYSAQVRFVDVVPNCGGGTPLHLAIPFAKSYGATRLVVVSDGLPDLKDQSMDEARNFGGQIDVVFVGNMPYGEQGSFFLNELAKATGGRRINADLSNVKELTGTIIGLLEGYVEEPKTILTGPGFSAVEAEEVGTEEEEEEDDDFDEEDEDEEDDEE